MSHENPRSPISLNRRQFLGEGARNAATAAAGVVGLSTVAAGRPTSRSANETVRLGMIGVRNQGLALARAFQETPGCEIAGICDVDAAVRTRAMRELELDANSLTVTDEFRRLLDNPEVDAVVIATPDHHHAWMSALAADAGKHIYLEIPTTHTSEQGVHLQKMLAKSDVTVQVGLQHRSGSHYQSAMRFLHAGELGKVAYAKAWACVPRQRLRSTEANDDASWSTEQQRLWLGPEKECPLAFADWHFQWRCLWQFGSGELGNWGVTLLDLARWGLQVALPERVTAAGGCYSLNDGREAPDTLHVQYDYADSAITWEHRQWTQRGIEGRPHGVAFYGERGTLILDRSGWKVYDSRISAGQPASKTPEPHARNFIDAILHGQPVAADFETGRISSELCHLGNQAYRNRQPVSLA
ncbi:Gfo/Idh/MocA family protein [Rubinisphaera margarita]|uniref:Gfo/Idh/MocA family protein n=1 Tax=Rubinisphaera margarita TaxID=2909586 RepID=UPI001EE82788|nr:Gfo/Idh/MocA family oxidoreductase [Rubinisphaera margarita]MCG6156856.1 Gfo/Idh/MocA family oxidoreductase [Rubinisphaera margarita]